MEKRPVSLTIIGWLLVLLAVLGIFGVITLASNPIAIKTIAQMNIPLAVEQGWGTVGALVNLVCAYAILKGLPWGRVLYLGWGIVGVVIGFYISPMKAAVVFSLIVLVVIAVVLWTNSANDWFSARGLMLRRERSG